LLASRDIRPSRVLGQNFLVDGNILQIILESAHVAEDDTVLEIGPGLGVLTEPLLARAGRVIAIEKDPRLAAYLREAFETTPHLTLIEGDAMEQDLSGLLQREAVTHVISNLPYSAGTRILMELIESEARPLRIVVMLQQDVADRLTASPGNKAYGIAGIFAQLHYDVVLRKIVAPTCFYPPPDVRSALVEFYRRAAPVEPVHDLIQFREVVKWCFSQRRKQLGRILHDAPLRIIPRKRETDAALDDVGLRPDQRPESVTVAEWVRLANRFGGKA